MTDAFVIGTDGSETAGRALDEAIRLGRAVDAEIHLVSAYRPLRGARVVGDAEISAPLPDTLVEATLEQAAAKVRTSGLKVESHAVESDPADALLKVAAEVGASTIVVGNRGMHGARRLLGSVPNKIAHGAGCNVLIVYTDRP
jgi:nucleotide-binding universal stress UspA family protein